MKNEDLKKATQLGLW